MVVLATAVPAYARSSIPSERRESTVWAMAAIGGTALVILLAAWLIRRSQRDIEGYHEEEYCDPPCSARPTAFPGPDRLGSSTESMWS